MLNFIWCAHRSIQGFMQRSDAEKMLLQSPSGTFLIRFSEGDPGGISVAWVNGECVCTCVCARVFRKKLFLCMGHDLYKYLYMYIHVRTAY